MKISKNSKKEGVVKLTEQRFSKDKKARPNVPATQKISTKDTKINKDKKSELPTVNQSDKKAKPINNVTHMRGQENNKFFRRDENGKLLITRRTVIYGAIGAGALIAGGAGVKFTADAINKNTNSIETLKVGKGDVINSDSLIESPDKFMSVSREIEMPYGTLAFANSSNIITCLVPTDKAKPLSQVELINSNNGKRNDVLEEAQSIKEGFEIYDARANSRGIIWTEVNILQGEWRIYASSFSSGYNINPCLIDKGNSDWETPTISVSEECAYWQVLPVATKTKSNLLSSLKKINLDQVPSNVDNFTEKVSSNSDIENNPYTIFTSNGRMATPVHGYKNGCVISPRAKSANIFYQLTYLDDKNQVADSIALPQNMKPLEVGYGKTGFNFAFDAIYNYGEGISNLGYYTPIAKANDNYNNLKWLNFSRNPSAQTAWCNGLFVVRSTMAVCLVNLDNQSYCILDRPNASDDYGDYLASSGDCEKIVTYANVHDQPVAGEESKYCSLRIWS